VLLLAVLMLAGLTAVPPAAPAQQQDTLDRARQQQVEQRRQQREAEERRERRRERQQEIQARIQRNAAAPAEAVNEQDSLALVALYESTGGYNWENSDGWLGAPVAEWHGVTVSGDRVVALSLDGSSFYGRFGLIGSLPPEMGDLTALQNLNLQLNYLTGQIPPELSQLSSLQDLNLEYNRLTGEIPPELGQLSSLQDLNLNDNDLTGEIPPELGQLSSLQDLDLNSNQLTGEIPSELSQLSSLQDLNLEYNRLTGEIPPELGQLSSLEGLYLRRNQLTGEIPPELGQLSSLEGLYLRRNQLTGEIPPELGQLSSLEGLYLRRNELTGEIPSELSQLSSLESLGLSENQLTGEIPPELSQLSSLESLKLHHNELTGAIPVSFTNLTSMSNSDYGSFYFYDTDLCEPPDSDFQDWLDSIDRVRGTGVMCSGDSPPVATTFSYPVGSKVNVPERITPETNNLYLDDPEADPKRESSDVGPYWRNAQDVGNYYSALGGIHAGEDWNWGSGTSDRGRVVYATANGKVLESDKVVSDSGPGAGGYAVIIEHEVPSGETYYSLYLHVVDVSSTNGKIEPPSISGTVERGQPIARVGDVTAYPTHLHFEIRDTNWDPGGSLYPNANPNGYYSHDGGVYTDGMTAPQVDDAFSLMRQDGLLDASDFIDNRSEAPSGLTASSGDGEVTLSWNGLPDGDVDGYNVYRSTSSFSDLGEEDKINDSLVENESYTDGAANGGTTYYYRVTAVGADGTESGPSGQASVALQSLQLLGLEVNQSVQTWKNDVPLVQGKKTIVRAHLQNKREGRTPVSVALLGFHNGDLLEAPTIMNDNYEAPASPSGDSVEAIRERRADMEKSLNFRIPESWTQKPSVTLALVGEGIDCGNTPSTDANCETEVYFQSTPTPKITVFSVAWEDETGTTHLPDYDITKVKDRLRAMYPINSIDITLGGDGIVIPCGEDEACGPPTNTTIFRKLDSHWKDDRSDGRITENRIYYGFVDEVNGGVDGSADLGGNVAFTATNGEGVFGATAHEIAHLHGLQHAVNEEENGTVDGFFDDRPLGFCGSYANPSAPDFPYADSTRIQVPDTLDWNGFTALGPIGEELNREVWGVNTEEGEMGNVVASSQHLNSPNAELMSYCFGAEFGVLWASDTTYTTLRDSINARFGTDTAPTLASANPRTPGSTTSSQVQSERGSSQEEDYLLVKGQLDIKEDTLEFRSFTTVTTTPGRVDAISPDPGSYTLQALDETGNVIEEVSFKPRIPVTKKLSEVGIFSVPLQADPAIEGVQVLGGGNGNSLSGKSGSGALTTNDVLGSKSASPNSPTVTVQYPNGGEDLSGDEVALEWSSDDPDGDSLSYTVKYSRNGGATWKALATSWPRDSLTVDAGALGGTSNGLVRVQASDGFNTAQDESDGTFGTSNVPPSASIFSPSDGAVIGQTGTVALNGSGSDTEDGSLSGPALEWRTASGDSLGTGETIDVPAANFSLGTHTIELVATDSFGASDTASVSIQVALSNDPSLQASESALVESGGLQDFGPTGTDIDFTETSGAGTVTAELYDSAPIGAGGIPESNVSHYRVLVDKQNGLTVGPETTVCFETATLSGIGDPTKVQIYQRPAPGNGPFAALDTQVDSMGTPSDSSDDEIYATVDGFGEFVLASDSEPLPVELSGFNATLDGEDAVRLTWTTASETGNAGFEVQRRAGDANGGSWTTVGSVEGKGTTTEPTSYRYVDEGLPYEADRLTYRLKQVDTDGSSSYSKEVTVSREVKEAELLGTYPNPARTQATLRYAVPERQDVKIYLYDVLGRRVQTVVDGEREGRHQRQLDTSRLASGVYFLRLRAGGATKTQKLTVVR